MMRTLFLASALALIAAGCGKAATVRIGGDGGEPEVDSDPARDPAARGRSATGLQPGDTDAGTPSARQADAGPADAAAPPTGAAERDAAPGRAPVPADAAPRDVAPPPRAAPDAADPVSPATPATGCEIVACGGGEGRTCCSSWIASAFDSRELMGVSRRDLVKSFSLTTSAVTAAFGFERAGQNGSMSMIFRQSRAIRSLKVQVQQGGSAGDKALVMVESAGATSGCFHDIDMAGNVNPAAGYDCWGPAFVPHHLVVWTKSRAAGPATLTVTSLAIDFAP